MDGVRRVLRSLNPLHFAAGDDRLRPVPISSQPASRAKTRPAISYTPAAPRSASRKTRSPRKPLARLVAFAHRPMATGLFLSVFLLTVGVYSFVRGGEYERFVKTIGSPGDLAAKAVGLGVEAVTISGLSELKEGEVLEMSGIDSRHSLLFLDAAMIRARLQGVPLIKDADVRKLYPDRLAINIVERQPYALWQKDGLVSIVAADGLPIDLMRDNRFEALPLVVGSGANGRLGEYSALLDAAGDLRGRIRAGILVSERRWTLKTNDNIDIKLPEDNPVAAVAALVKLQRDTHILDRDLVSIDLRTPGRLFARMSEEAASLRGDALTRRTRGKV